MYKVKDIVRVIEDFAPLSLQEKWDNSGLSIGSPEAEVTSVLIGLDCTPELVDEAVECGADMIVTHHPLIFSGMSETRTPSVNGVPSIEAIISSVLIPSTSETVYSNILDKIALWDNIILH